MSSTVWQSIRQEAKELVENEPMLASFFHSTILKHHNLGSALSYILANKLANTIMPAIALRLLKKPIRKNQASLNVLPVTFKQCVSAIRLWSFGQHHCFI